MQIEIVKETLELCYEIEKLPASEQQTNLSIKAAALYQKVQPLVPPDDPNCMDEDYLSAKADLLSSRSQIVDAAYRFLTTHQRFFSRDNNAELLADFVISEIGEFIGLDSTENGVELPDGIEERAKAEGASINKIRDMTELNCEKCERDYPVWFAPDELWNQVCRTVKPEIHFLCLTCFAVLAEKSGVIPVSWALTPRLNHPFDNQVRGKRDPNNS